MLFDRFPSAQTQPWAKHAQCLGMLDRMFPESGGREVIEAKRICNGDPKAHASVCPVRAQCLKWALDYNETHGVWGGKSERERRGLRRDRRASGD